MTRRATVFPVLLALALLVTACAEESLPDAPADPTEAYPVEVAGVTIPARPERIVSGSATHTEILFAIGAGSQVVAVDMFSDYPAEAADLPRVDTFTPSVEAIAALDPDLVILTFDPVELVPALEVLGIPVLVLDAPDDLDGVYAQYAELGVAVGRQAEAADLVEQMEKEIEAIVAALPQDAGALTYFHELDANLWTVRSDTFIGALYGLLGMTSIADSAADKYVQLSAEFILESDPDLIFLADAQCCGESPETVAARPGWGSLTAVQTGRVFEIDESIASRWGPRLVEFLRSIAEVVYGEAR